jgi:hypothetical protein
LVLFSLPEKQKKKKILQNPKAFLGRYQTPLSMGWMFLYFFKQSVYFLLLWLSS